MATTTWDSGYTKTLTILSGQNVSSDIIDMTRLGRRLKLSVTIFAPATLPETITLEVAPSVSGTFTGHTSGGGDIAVAAGKSLTVTDVVAGAIRLKSASNVAGDRVFQLLGTPET